MFCESRFVGTRPRTNICRSFKHSSRHGDRLLAVPLPQLISIIVVTSVEAPINRVLIDLAIVSNGDNVFADIDRLIDVDLEQLKIVISCERIGELKCNRRVGDCVDNIHTHNGFNLLVQNYLSQIRF